jgi:ketosteroid isomerase-like protein
MSEQNVAIVTSLQPAPDADLAQLFRDDDLWDRAVDVQGSLFDPDLKCAHRLIGGDRIYAGSEGLRASWLDWIAPWESYRVEVEDVIDCGDRVLVLVYDYGRRAESAEEIKSHNAAVWTLRDGKVISAEFYADRAWALRAVGLET